LSIVVNCPVEQRPAGPPGTLLRHPSRLAKVEPIPDARESQAKPDKHHDGDIRFRKRRGIASGDAERHYCSLSKSTITADLRCNGGMIEQRDQRHP
jgi:hypothetical protein